MGGGRSAPGADAAAEVELLFARYFTIGKDEGGSYVGRNNGPNGYHNWAGNTPIGLLVDDYEMANGDPFDWGNNAHKSNPYKNRRSEERRVGKECVSTCRSRRSP